MIKGFHTNVLDDRVFMCFQERVRDMLKCLVHRFLSCLPRMHRRRVHTRYRIVDINAPYGDNHRSFPFTIRSALYTNLH